MGGKAILVLISTPLSPSHKTTQTVNCARLQHEQCQVASYGTKECSSSAKHSGETLRKMGYSAVSGDDGEGILFPFRF